MSNNLDIVAVAQGQVDNGVLAVNNALGKHDAAMTEIFELELTGISASLADEDLIGAQMFFFTGSPGGEVLVDIPAVQRGSFWVYNGSDETIRLGVSGQSAGFPVLLAGQAAALVCDGTNVRRSAALPWSAQIALSDETSALSVASGVLTTYVEADVDLDAVFVGLSTPSSSGPVTVDANKNGATIFTTKPTIDEGEDTSHTGTQAVLSVTSLAKYDKLTFDIDAAGIGATGLKIILTGSYR